VYFSQRVINVLKKTLKMPPCIQSKRLTQIMVAKPIGRLQYQPGYKPEMAFTEVREKHDIL